MVGGLLAAFKKTKAFSVCDVEPIEIAKHLTAIDWKYFRKIKTKELIKKAWSHVDKETQSPNLVKLIETFNKTANWIVLEILTTGNPKLRVKVLERFIEVLKALKTMQNFHGVFVLYSALTMQCLQTLKSVWDAVSAKHISIVREVEQLIDPRSNFKSYRNFIKKCVPPLIPFEGLYLQDITFIEENPDFIGELVNYEKLEMFGKIILTIKKNQQQRYKHMHENLLISDMITKSPFTSEDLLWKFSTNIRMQENSRRESLPKQLTPQSSPQLSKHR